MRRLFVWSAVLATVFLVSTTGLGSASVPKPNKEESKKGFLGIYLNRADAPGEVRLQGIIPGSPADKAGLKKGDVVLRYGKAEVTDANSFMAALAKTRPGDKIILRVNRDGKTLDFTIALVERPPEKD